MSSQFFYEDGKGHIYRKSEKIAMDWEDDVNLLLLDILTNKSQYLAAKKQGKSVVNKTLDEAIEEISIDVEATRPKKPYNLYCSEQCCYLFSTTG